MKFQIKNRFTQAVQVEVELEASFKSSPFSVQLGAAVKVALNRNADLSSADLRSANLSYANLRSANLSYADLSYADLRYTNLSYADLSCADLRSANLSHADLRSANLRYADLSYADLRYTNLSYADLSSIENDIRVPSLHRRILAAIGSGGTFDMSKWHGEGGACGTTHCRAGWSIHFAGAAGRVLEVCMGPSAAGALIHLASCPHLEGRVPNFSDTNENALADIRRLAELEEPIGTCPHCGAKR
jgi:Pentapeptide repeats (8 copies)